MSLRLWAYRMAHSVGHQKLSLRVELGPRARMGVTSF